MAGLHYSLALHLVLLHHQVLGGGGVEQPAAQRRPREQVCGARAEGGQGRHMCAEHQRAA